MNAGQRNAHCEIADLASSYGLDDVLFAVAYYARQQQIKPAELRAMLKAAQAEVRATIERDGLEDEEE